MSTPQPCINKKRRIIEESDDEIDTTIKPRINKKRQIFQDENYCGSSNTDDDDNNNNVPIGEKEEAYYWKLQCYKLSRDMHTKDMEIMKLKQKINDIVNAFQPISNKVSDLHEKLRFLTEIEMF